MKNDHVRVLTKTGNQRNVS